MKLTLLHATLLTGLCIALAVVTITLSGCRSLANLVIENPRYSIREVRPRVDIAIPLSASAIDFDFTIGIDNPNSVGIRLDRLDFNLRVNDNPILDSVSDQGIEIPARGYGDVRLRTRVGYNNIRNLWREVLDLVQGQRARYEIRGNAYFNTPIGQKRFPVTIYSTERR